jgi:hypothetical protein
MGEWKVAPFLRTMLVLRVSDLASERVTGVLRGLEDMVAGRMRGGLRSTATKSGWETVSGRRVSYLCVRCKAEDGSVSHKAGICDANVAPPSGIGKG